MKFGAMNNPFNSILNEIKLFGEFKFDYVDLTIESPNATSEKLLKQEKEINDLLSTYNLGLVGHMPWYFEISHPYEHIRKAVVKEATRILETANKFDIEKVSIHAEPLPNFWKKNRKKLLERQIKTVSELVKVAKNLNMTLCVENMDDRSMTVDEFRILFNKVPEAKFHLDVGHANIMSSSGDRIFEFIRTFKNRLHHMHISDNDGLEDQHLPIGTGIIDWNKVVRTLKEIKYNKTITLEIFSQDKDYLKISKDKIKKMFKN